jgi:queuine/archaeosine tRNA-ribosyltransferase
MVRGKSIVVGGKLLKTPAYIPSISSSTIPDESIQFVDDVLASFRDSRLDALMISVYDLSREGALLYRYAEKSIDEKYAIHKGLGINHNLIIYLDSGGFELGQRDVSMTQWDDPRDVYAFQRFSKGDCFVILDYPVPRGWRKDQLESIRMSIESAVQIARDHDSRASLMAVAHGYDKNSLLTSVSRLAEIDLIDSIAISHKEIPGTSTADSFAIMYAAKETIKRSRSQKSLHVLASGDISNWLFFSLVGVDTFDSTNWIDKIAFLEGFTWATLDEMTPTDSCKCKSCSSSGISFSEIWKIPSKRMSHNLEVVAMIMDQVRTELEEHHLHQLLTRVAPELCRKLEVLLGKDLHSLYEDS